MTFFLFTQPTCAGCKVLKDWIPEYSKMDYRVIDASTPEGLESARAFKVAHTPTCIFFDDNQNEVRRSGEVSEIKKLIYPLVDKNNIACENNETS